MKGRRDLAPVSLDAPEPRMDAAKVMAMGGALTRMPVQGDA